MLAEIFLIMRFLIFTHCYKASAVTLDLTPKFLKNEDFTKLNSKIRNLLATKCGKPLTSSRNLNILNGIEETNENSPNFHWAVGVFRGDPVHGELFCTGTLISPLHVVTAGHCLVSGDQRKAWAEADFYVAAGAKCIKESQECGQFGSHRVIAKVKNAVAPGELFKAKRRGGDIVILLLDTAIDLNNRIDFACLPPHDMDLPFEKPNFIHWGWGRKIVNDSNSAPAVLNYLKGVSIFDCLALNDLPDQDALCSSAGTMSQGVGKGDSGSGLEYFEGDFETGKHFVVGITGYIYGPSDEIYSTDLRVYSKWICDLTGICYME